MSFIYEIIYRLIMGLLEKGAQAFYRFQKVKNILAKSKDANKEDVENLKKAETKEEIKNAADDIIDNF